MISDKNEFDSGLADKLHRAYNSGDGFKFWNLVHNSVSDCTEIILKSSKFPQVLKNKLIFYNALSLIPWGIAPVLNPRIQSIIRAKFNYKYFSAINFQDFNIAKTQDIIDVLNNKFQKEIIEEMSWKYKNSGFNQNEIKYFLINIISKLKNRWSYIVSDIQLVKNSSEKCEIFEKIECKKIFLNVLSNLVQTFVDIQSPQMLDEILFYQTGFIPFQVDNELFLLYGFSGRTEFFKDIIFGETSVIKLNNIYADFRKLDFETGEQEFFKQNTSELQINLRKSDNLEITFKIAEKYENLRNLQDLRKIPCPFEVRLTRDIKISEVSKPKKLSKHTKIDKAMLIDRDSENLIQNFLSVLLENAKELTQKLDFSKLFELISPETLQIIAKFVNLTELNLNNAMIKTSQLNNLEGLKTLEILRINVIYVDDEKIDLYKLFPQLRTLEAQETTQIIKLLAASSNLNMITQLDLSNQNVKSTYLNDLPEMLNLQEFTLAGIDFTDSDFNFALKCKSLHSLIIKDSKHSHNSLSGISEYCNNLLNLDISSHTFDINLSSDDFTSIAFMKNLQKLDISGRPVSDSFIKILSANSENLRELNLSYTLVSNLALEHLHRFEFLAKLNLEGCRQITDFGIETITRTCPKLREINIKGTSTTESSSSLLIQHYKNIVIKAN